MYIEQEVDIEDVTKGETFEGPSYEDFAQKDSDENLDFKPLYSGAAITVWLSALLIITFALSGEALSDMLTLISWRIVFLQTACAWNLFLTQETFSQP